LEKRVLFHTNVHREPGVMRGEKGCGREEGGGGWSGGVRRSKAEKKK